MLIRISKSRLNALMAVLAFVLAPISAQAQLIDLISDYVEGQINNYIQSYIDQYIPSGSQLWDTFVDYSAKASLENKSKTLADFDVNNPNLSAYPSYSMIVVSNGVINTDRTLRRINERTMPKFNQGLYSASNIKFSNMGGGILAAKCDAFLTQADEAYKIKTLESVLNSEVMSILNAQADSVIKSTLLADVNSTPGLIPVLNSTPKTIEFYCKLIGSDIRLNPAELFYWVNEAAYYSENLPKKKNKLINPEDLKFVQKNSTVEISHDHKVIAIYTPQYKQYAITSPEFLNFSARPQHRYSFENTTFDTEELGRIKSIKFSANKKQNKTKLKNPVKYDDIAKTLTGSNKQNLYSELLKKYNVTPAVSFAVSVVPDKKFKEGLKSFDKSNKKAIKSGSINTITVKFSYSGVSDAPDAIVITPGSTGSDFILH